MVLMLMFSCGKTNTTQRVVINNYDGELKWEQSNTPIGLHPADTFTVSEISVYQKPQQHGILLLAQMLF